MVTAEKLRRVLEQELPQIAFDAEVVQYMAGAEGMEAGEPTEDAATEAWSPFLISHAAANDDESARDLCRQLLRRLRSDDSSTTASDPLSPEQQFPGAVGSTAGADASRRAEGPVPVGDKIRQRKAQQSASEAVQGLEEWLKELRLERYIPQAQKWCESKGAAFVGEVIDEWEDFAKSLALKPLEVKRVQKAYEQKRERGQAEQRNELPEEGGERVPQEDSVAADLARRAQAEGRHTFGPKEDPSRYYILEELGAGASATVYRCVKRPPDSQEFAVKVISLQKLRMQSDPKTVLERLHRETQILFSLRHKHVVQLYDVVETSDRLNLVMELVEGGELFDAIISSPGSRLQEPEARYIFLQLADALQYIHSKGVVHRDLKPENILVDRKASQPGFLQVKISDFGHSKHINDGYSLALTRVGTPQYWAPEVSDSVQCQRGYTEKVDLWSLGVVLYVMLEGTYPFDGTGDRRIEDQVREANFNFRSDSRTSRDARDLIRALIQKKPQDRLPLEKCKQHQWIPKVFTRIVESCSGGQDDEERFALPESPSQETVRLLKREMQRFSTTFKRAAVLRKTESQTEVVITWGDATPAQREAPRAWLSDILTKHFPHSSAEFELLRGAPTASVASAAVGSPLPTVQEEVGRPRSGYGGGRFRPITTHLNMIQVRGQLTHGLHLTAEPTGLRVDAIDDLPGSPGTAPKSMQPNLMVGDLIVKIEEVLLGNKPLQRIAEVFQNLSSNGATLLIRRTV